MVSLEWQWTKVTGSRNGWLYIVTTDKNITPAGSDPDIILHRSTDSGQTWSDGIRVNQDQLNNGKIQYFPAIDIDNTGAINIIYYDDRNTSSDSAEIFIFHDQLMAVIPGQIQYLVITALNQNRFLADHQITREIIFRLYPMQINYMLIGWMTIVGYIKSGLR